MPEQLTLMHLLLRSRASPPAWLHALQWLGRSQARQPLTLHATCRRTGRAETEGWQGGGEWLTGCRTNKLQQRRVGRGGAGRGGSNVPSTPQD
jgi:hypothetical protein